MKQNPIIVIADRSELSSNMYALLLSPFKAQLIVRRRFEAARPFFFRREGVDLGIFSSNIFGKKFDELFRHLSEDEPVRRARKIFICRESPAEEEWREKLSLLRNSKVVSRPFHPDEFIALVRRSLEGSA